MRLPASSLSNGRTATFCTLPLHLVWVVCTLDWMSLILKAKHVPLCQKAVIRPLHQNGMKKMQGLLPALIINEYGASILKKQMKNFMISSLQKPTTTHRKNSKKPISNLHIANHKTSFHPVRFSDFAFFHRYHTASDYFTYKLQHDN
jgi:hypothetical protein